MPVRYTQILEVKWWTWEIKKAIVELLYQEEGSDVLLYSSFLEIPK